MNKFTSSINSPIPTSLRKECKKAAKILNEFIDPGQGVDKIIPSNILEKAQGLAIYTVLKAGFLFSGRAGSGLVVARLPDNSWSAPSAIGTGGIGAGGQIGAELTDVVLVLNTKEAVKTFSQFGNVTLGGNVSVAAGPLGRNAEASGTASLKHIAAIYSYSRTRGLFAGVSIEGSVVVTRGDANEKLYGRRVSAKELLNGSVTPPSEADELYRALNAKFRTLGNTTAAYQNREETEQRFNSSSISPPGTLSAPPIRQNNYQSPPGGRYNAPPAPQMPAPPAYSSSPSAAANPTVYNEKSSYPQTTPTKQMGRPPPPPPPISRKPKPTEPMAEALYDFDGEQDGDLSFKQNDIITIIKKSDSQDDWWTGKIGSREGAFPANYVRLR